MNRESRYANELAEKLNDLGQIIRRSDVRVIRQAFERHFREVQSDTISATMPKMAAALRKRIATLQS